jgi:hypothetical protein
LSATEETLSAWQAPQARSALAALQAGAACCLAIVGADTRAADQDRYGKKTERESVQHVAATLARPAH